MRVLQYRFVAPGMLVLGFLAVDCSRSPRLLPDESATPPALSDLMGSPETAWKVKLPTPPAALLRLSNQTLLAVTHRGELYRLNLDTGKRDGPIRQPFRTAITAQLIHRGGPCLFAASALEEDLRAYHLGTGRQLWKRKTAGITGPLGLTEGLLLASTLTGEVAAYDIQDGHTVWRSRLPRRIYQGVRVLEDRAFVLTDEGTLYAFAVSPNGTAADPSGKDHLYLWRRELPVGPNAVLAAGGGLLIVADSRGQLMGINPTTGETIFQAQLDAPIYSRPLIADGVVVVATAAGEIIALQDSDGSQVWRMQGEGLVKHPLLAAGGPAPGAVLVPFARGVLLALDLATGRELWRHQLDGPIELASVTPEGVAVVDRQNNLYHLRMTGSPTPR